MKFQDMPYSRPDKGEVIEQIKEFTERMKSASSFAEAKEVVLDKNVLDRHLSTLGSLVTIRHSVNTEDKFYDEEEKFFNEAMPEIQEYEHQWEDALLTSPFRKELAEEFGEVTFINLEISRKSFSPEIIPEMQKENNLVQEYEKLLASAQIPFEGKTYTIAQIAPLKLDKDDDRRLRAWKAEGKWYKDNQAELDRLYDELVKVRHTMGVKLGNENYTQLGYYRMGRNCYTKDDVEKFRNSVVKYLVPVADKIFRNKAERFGKEYPMSFADNVMMFTTGEAEPVGSAEDIVANCQKFFDSLSPETAEFFKTMTEGNLLDLLSTQGKQGGGYCTEILDYDVPFIFANFNGTRDDVETLVHESGHAYAAWKNIKRIPTSTIWPTMEGCEVHSMSMEFFCWPWAELFFGADTKKFLYSHLAGSLTFIPYGTMVDHFQHLVYENPDWTPAERHSAWKKLLGIYMPWQRLDGDIPFYADGEGWQRQHHIYSFPFYYIDYCLAQTVALEFWSRIQDNLKDAWNTYNSYTSMGGSLVFTELLKKAGLNNPFEEDCLKNICQKAEKWLDNYDLTGV